MYVSSVIPAQNLLGEGPTWSVANQALYWIDILNAQLFAWSPASQQTEQWQLPEHIGSFGFLESGKLIVALSSGLAFFDKDSGKVEWIARPEPNELNTRFNDGKCGPGGRFWAGTMCYDEDQVRGSLYCLHPDKQIEQKEHPVGISNGLDWSLDHQIFYHTDSPLRTIFAYDYDVASGHIQNKRVFAQITDGFPDGLTLDAEGYIWSAIWDGWCLLRFAPDGSIDKKIDLPVQRPSCCTFGGPDLNQLYITSARKGLSPEALAQQELAGNVLMVEPGVSGRAAFTGKIES